MNTFYLNASADELKLAVAACEPSEAPKGIVQLVHGMCEHKERYYPFMEWLAGKGYVAVIHDHRGHGGSVKCADDLGFMYSGGWSAMVDDTKIVTDWARQNYPGLRLTLLGHSMGSMVVRSFTKRYDSAIDSLIVCGSPSDNPAKGVGKALAGLIGIVRGWHHRPALIQAMSFGAYNKPFEGEAGEDGTKFHSAWVCSDKQILDAYHKDPLCQYVFTANGFRNLLGLMQDCYSTKGWAMANKELPVHFISGALDPCRTDDKAFEKAVQAMKAVGYSNVTSKLYPDMRHEILNETDRQKVWDDVLEHV